MAKALDFDGRTLQQNFLLRDRRHDDGNEVVLHWGDFGKRIKQVRATVERFPYLDLPSNKDYDLSQAPARV